MIEKKGAPWYADGDTELTCYIMDDAKPLVKPGYFNYETVYISEDIVPQLSLLTINAFGIATTIESFTILNEALGLPVKTIEWNDMTLYEDVSGWNIDR